MITVPVSLGDRSYDVLIGRGARHRLLEVMPVGATRAAVVTQESVGVRIEVHHHEVATGGQTEIDMRYDTLTKMADKVLWYKYCAKMTAKKWGKTATFMPKPLFQDNGSGMHTHQSLWKNGKNLFYERGGYADVSKTCLYYIGGILKHAPALLALIAPSTNSYRRLVPGYEAPINLVYSQRNRSACIRIPMYSKSEGAKRIEFRTPDPTCNPYLSFAACVMASSKSAFCRSECVSPATVASHASPMTS